jgi:hypothetical protein
MYLNPNFKISLWVQLHEVFLHLKESMRRKHFNEDKRQRTNVQSKQVTVRVK